MERLTNKTLKVACDSFVSFSSKEERAKYRMLAESAPKYEELYKRLAEYEDLEEQGLLKRLPVKEGNTVYEVRYMYDCNCDYECPFAGLDKYKCDRDVRCENEYKDYYVREIQFNYKMMDNVEKTVFLTKEDAERKLEEIIKGE